MRGFREADLAAMWDALRWGSGSLVRVNREIDPLEAPRTHPIPGLYKMAWVGVDYWPSMPKVIGVEACDQIPDPRLLIEHLEPPVLLTIGRTTSVYDRIRQHFSTNDNCNRVFKRLYRWLPGRTNDDMWTLATANIMLEWAYVPSWIDRAQIEQYACARFAPLFDLEAEH
jgi:hypothetical protein